MGPMDTYEEDWSIVSFSASLGFTRAVYKVFRITSCSLTLKLNCDNRVLNFNFKKF
jgi:hypothetical protein